MEYKTSPKSVNNSFSSMKSIHSLHKTIMSKLMIASRRKIRLTLFFLNILLNNSKSILFDKNCDCSVVSEFEKE